MFSTNEIYERYSKLFTLSDISNNLVEYWILIP